jgi:hypothetical protein
VLEIPDTPTNLGIEVPWIAKGKNGVTVGLGQGVSVASVALAASSVGLHDGLIDLWLEGLEPSQKGGSYIKAYEVEVVGYLQDSAFRVQKTGCAVWGIAFGSNAGGPVVIGCRRVLNLYGFKPRVFPGGLVEMTVNADKLSH